MGSNSVATQMANPLSTAFGSNSVVGQIGQIDPVSYLYNGGSSLVDGLKPPSTPQLQTPASAPTGTPTLAQTNTTALQTQLASEHNAASTSTVLTGGQGLLDEPTTTSRVLMGN